jgi:hypothetical protein
MNKIKFSHNWNDKLNHSIFTTIRKCTEEKYIYYSDLLGTNFEILLNNIKIGEANLIDIDLYDFKTIPNGLLHTDTGIINNYEIGNLFKKFGITQTDRVLILTFKKNETIP